MMLKRFIIKGIFILLCIASSSSNTSEDMAKDFIEHVLRIPNPDRVLNTIIGRLEKYKPHDGNRPRNADEIDCDEPAETLPEYTETIQQASHERDIRQLSIQKHYPICHLERKIRKLNTNEYEYRPAYYEEVRCIMTNSGEIEDSNEICSSLGFACVQWNKTIHLTRRRYSSDCWETRTMVIPAGCECMWPVHKLGDIKMHT